MKNIPEYAQDPVYQKMIEWVKMLGMRVEYSFDDESALAQTDGYTVICMGSDDEYKNAEHAALVLGHEIGHNLQKNAAIPFSSYRDYGFYYVEEDELEADVFGSCLYKLALSILNCEEEE